MSPPPLCLKGLLVGPQILTIHIALSQRLLDFENDVLLSHDIVLLLIGRVGRIVYILIIRDSLKFVNRFVESFQKK